MRQQRDRDREIDFVRSPGVRDLGVLKPSRNSTQQYTYHYTTMELRTLRRHLPKSFCGAVPLQSGMELILVFTVINKMSGFFGLLSLFTDHPITFLQWVYYFTNALFVILAIFCYRSLRQLAAEAVRNSPLNTDENLARVKIIAIFVALYIVDFFIGHAFMVYLAKVWLSEEYGSGDNTSSVESTSASAPASAASVAQKATNKLVKRVSETLSLQSASEGYEVFVCVVSILITDVFRVYFMAVALSYYLRLRKHVTRPATGLGAKFVDLLDKFN